jgi:hypothetical protein
MGSEISAASSAPPPVSPVRLKKNTQDLKQTNTNVI